MVFQFRVTGGRSLSQQLRAQAGAARMGTAIAGPRTPSHRLFWDEAHTPAHLTHTPLRCGRDPGPRREPTQAWGERASST